MNHTDDRLFALLPAVYRARDEERGWPLRSLLRVIASQAGIVEDDIRQLYDNWFIETCEDWVVPYLGALIGYAPVLDAGQVGAVSTRRGQALNRILAPRAEVADTIANRRRKGTLPLMELLARETAGWPAHAVEFYRLLGWTQSMNHLQPLRGGTADLHNAGVLDRTDGPFDSLAHTVDVHRISCRRSAGRYNIPSVGVFVWRLRPYAMERSLARRVNKERNGFTFSALGNDAPLYSTAAHSVPEPVRLRAFEIRHADSTTSVNADYYGPGKSIEIFTGGTAVAAKNILPADLRDWSEPAGAEQVAVDPWLGRLVFARKPKEPVEVRSSYGFSTEMGGGPYPRKTKDSAGAAHYLVGQSGAAGSYKKIQDALDASRKAGDPEAVIEITDNATYKETLQVTVAEGAGLQIHSTSGKRPVIRIKDDDEDMNLVLGTASRFHLDGLVVEGGRLYVQRDLSQEGAQPELAGDDRPLVVICHCTLVPGWNLKSDCCPVSEDEPSLVLDHSSARVEISHSILGTIHVKEDEVATEPLPIRIQDSILDATKLELEAISAVFEDDNRLRKAHATVEIVRCTVVGGVHVHAIELAEDSIFLSGVQVARSQIGCVRFCYVPPGSRTPRRYRCQPDLVADAALDDAAAAREIARVLPSFNSLRYGSPAYCQLAASCAIEITGGASDESEMGAFHDLFQPQRAANLRARLAEFTPASTDAGIIYAS
jgi:hypothetical protein